MENDEKIVLKQYFLAWCMRLDSDIEQQLSFMLSANSLSEKEMRLSRLRDLVAHKQLLCNVCNDLHALLHLSGV